MNNYLVATIHPWNIARYQQYSQTLPGKWHLITTKDELTLDKIDKITPKYIFFPHWSWIVPEEILNKYTCVCFHMTDLPYGRGGSPLQNLIMNGLSETKVSALQMTTELDAGPIFIKKPLTLTGSAEDIFLRLAKVVAQMIAEMVTSSPIATPQQGDVVYFKRRTPQQSEIPEGLSTKELYNFIRMLDAPGYPKAFIYKDNYKLEFTQAQITANKLTAEVTFIVQNNNESSKSCQNNLPKK